MSIKAVVFDFGKVICHPPSESRMELLASAAGVTRNIFEPVLWKLRGSYDNGSLTTTQYYSAVLNEINVSFDDSKLLRLRDADYNCWININQETVKLMEDIKRSGIILGILSNMPFEFLKLARQNLEVCRMPDVSVYSCEAGVNKPERAIYEKLLTGLAAHSHDGCVPEEVVFFDDMPENVKAARDLKINAFVWKDCDTARSDLTQLGVF